jgi:radical SAM protein with 4Fe4S-binding SPASM domain
VKWLGKHIKKNSSDAWLGNYNALREKKKRHRICHAPFKSLTFFLGGKVMSCWHNKQYLLGTIPENTIEEIWNGKPLQILRKAIEEKNLDMGCFECKKNLHSENYSAAGAPRYDYLPETVSGFPVSMDFQTDDTCNNACIMCNGEYSSTVRTCREKKERYPNPYGNEFIAQLNPYIPYLKEASFSGGEVFLSDFYFSIWDRFALLNPAIRISVTTNGTVLNEKVKSYLNRFPFNINLSLDTLDPLLFSAIRVNSKLDEVLRHLDYFEEYTRSRKTELIVRVCIMQQNWHTVPELIRYLNRKNIRLHINPVIFPAHSSLLTLPREKLEHVRAQLEEAFASPEAMPHNNRIVWEDFLKTMRNQQPQVLPTVSEDPGEILELRNQIGENIRQHITCRSFGTEKEKESQIRVILESLELCMTEISPLLTVQNAFRYYLRFPVNRLVDELSIRSPEKIVEFTRQAGTISFET